MAIFFNCSYARAAILSYTTYLASKNHSLLFEAKKERRQIFIELFSFALVPVVEAEAKQDLSTFVSATEPPDAFDRCCSRLCEVCSRTWPGIRQ